jgi:hypothetical protein
VGESLSRANQLFLQPGAYSYRALKRASHRLACGQAFRARVAFRHDLRSPRSFSHSVRLGRPVSFWIIREAAVADQVGDPAENWEHSSSNNEWRYSSRNASSGEIKLARSAGINDAANADNPSVTTAPSVTAGLYGFMP